MPRTWGFTVDCSTSRISPVKKIFPDAKNLTLLTSQTDSRGGERRQSGSWLWGRWGTEHRKAPSVSCHSTVPWVCCLHTELTLKLSSAFAETAQWACIKYFADSSADPACLSLAQESLCHVPALLYSFFWESIRSCLCFAKWFLEEGLIWS